MGFLRSNQGAFVERAQFGVYNELCGDCIIIYPDNDVEVATRWIL
jgi:hypothetical protein